MGKKVVSIVLFGDAEKYVPFFAGFVRAHLNLFQIAAGWVLRVHVDDGVAESRCGGVIRALDRAGLLEARRMGPAPLCMAMLWRMVPVFDESVDYVFCRDVDACPTPRDRAVCEQFISSGCVLHTCMDSVSHIGIMGGLCGFRCRDFRRLTGWRSLGDLYADAEKHGVTAWEKHGADQDALNRLLLVPGGPPLLEHRYNGWGAGKPHQAPSREAGVYPQASWSVPVPDEGQSRLSPELAREADRLGQHLGSAGFDTPAVIEFWDRCGDPGIAAEIKRCEVDA